MTSPFPSFLPYPYEQRSCGHRCECCLYQCLTEILSQLLYLGVSLYINLDQVMYGCMELVGWGGNIDRT